MKASNVSAVRGAEFCPSPGIPGEGRVETFFERSQSAPTPSLPRRTGRGGKSGKMQWPWALILLVAVCCGADAPPSGPYANDFEKAELGKPADELMILNGNFNVVQIDKNKCLELSPDPVDGDGFLFGPAGLTGSTVSARIWASSTGHRFPEFGVGSNDAGGYKLVVVPTDGVVQLRKGDDVRTIAPFQWKSETWTRLKLHVAKSAEGKMQIEGKAWPDGSPEPKDWTITMQDAEAPSAGRSSAWGMPYSGTPIRFDDLSVTPGEKAL